MTIEQVTYLLRHFVVVVAGVVLGATYGLGWGLVLVALALGVGAILGIIANGKD